MSAWRAAGISYVRFSFVASNAMKKGLNADALGKLIFPLKKICSEQRKKVRCEQLLQSLTYQNFLYLKPAISGINTPYSMESILWTILDFQVRDSARQVTITHVLVNV